MSNSTKYQETIQLSFTYRSIKLSSAQLFFLENYLRKQNRSILIHSGPEILKGKVVLTISRVDSKEKVDLILKKLMNYLIAFQKHLSSFQRPRIIRIEQRKISSIPLQNPFPTARMEFKF